MEDSKTVKCISLAPIPHSPKMQLDFGHGLSIGATPEWLWEQDLSRTITPPRKTLLASKSQFCFIRLYESDNVIGENELKSIHLIESATVAVWITQLFMPTWDHIWHFAEHDGNWNLRSFGRFDSVQHQSSNNQILEKPDRDKVTVSVHEGILCQEDGSTLSLACRLLRRAIVEPYDAIRYAIQWIILEALYGPEDGREITFRMCQRIALFLTEMRDVKTWEGDDVEAYMSPELLNAAAKKAYSVRSKIVHGMRIKNKKGETDSFHCTEDLVMVSLLKILQNPELQETFNSRKKREPYLDSLIFS